MVQKSRTTAVAERFLVGEKHAIDLVHRSLLQTGYRLLRANFRSPHDAVLLLKLVLLPTVTKEATNFQNLTRLSLPEVPRLQRRLGS